MSTKQQWLLDQAYQVAWVLAGVLEPDCEKILVCGSIRRDKAAVSDAEIMYIPKFGKEPDGLFGTKPVNLAAQRIDDLVNRKVLAKRLNKKGSVTWGDLNRSAVDVDSGIPVDLFATTAERWWVTVVIRTGPKEFNIRLIESAKAKGFRLHAYGVLERIGNGERVAPASERELFSLCGMKYLEPWER